MILCHNCGAEELDVHIPIAAPAKKLPYSKKSEPKSWQWSQVSQQICPVCGAVHAHICCDREK